MPNYIDQLRSHMSRQPSKLPEKETSEDAIDASSDVLPADITAQLAEEDGVDQQEIQKQWLLKCVGYTMTLFRAAAGHKPVKIDALAKHVASLLTSLSEKPERITNLELAVSREFINISKADKNLGDLIGKSIMMMLYAIKVGFQLRYNGDELHALVFAAMLHHIGMAQIPADIRHKKKKLNASELSQIRAAPEKGVAYLRQCGINDERILSAAAQAQERFDGSGPTGLQGNDISRTASIIGLLSMFEALIHYRAYRKRLLPRDAIRELLMHHKSFFDPALLKCLIDAISLYPVGTYVQLNSGDIGQVIRENSRLPMRPTVQLSMDRHGNGIVPRDVNLQTQTTLIVEHCMYPEDVAEISQNA